MCALCHQFIWVYLQGLLLSSITFGILWSWNLKSYPCEKDSIYLFEVLIILIKLTIAKSPVYLPLCFQDSGVSSIVIRENWENFLMVRQLWWQVIKIRFMVKSWVGLHLRNWKRAKARMFIMLWVLFLGWRMSHVS